jgi:hypothetical protein
LKKKFTKQDYQDHQETTLNRSLTPFMMSEQGMSKSIYDDAQNTTQTGQSIESISTSSLPPFSPIDIKSQDRRNYRWPSGSNARSRKQARTEAKKKEKNTRL